MPSLEIYRKRLIPNECFHLKDDIIIAQNENIILTKWNTLKPKKEFSHGASCYFLKKGIKVSKFYRNDNTLLYWYCDIVSYQWEQNAGRLTVTDLLADVIIYPDGRLQVVDLDELAEALSTSLLPPRLVCSSLCQLQQLLTDIHSGCWHLYEEPLKNAGL